MSTSRDAVQRHPTVVSFGDRTRARTAMLNQLLLGIVVLTLAIVAAVSDFEGDRALFYFAVVLVFLATAAAIAVPWNKVPLYVGAVVPLIDIVAIALMREATPSSGFGLLWIFPAMWLAGSFGVAGLLIAIGSICAIYTVQTITAGERMSLSTLILPFAVIALSSTSYMTARRTLVQRRLLDNQTDLLGEALARARQQEEILTEVLDAVDFGVIRVSADGRTSVTNDAHARLQRALDSADPDTDVEQPVYARDGVTPLDPEHQPFARAMRGQTFDDEVVWFGEPGGERRALTVTARRVHTDVGSAAGSVIVSRDVTAELSAIRAREDLVASVSHELRTPLTSILGYLELVLDDDLAPSSRRKLEVAERNANRLLAIVSDILTASSADSTSDELSFSPVYEDVSALVAAAAELQAPRAAERGIVIDTSGLETAVAYVDPSRLRQVLDNLLSNAVKYNVDGGRIEVGSTVEGAHAWIVVRDTGTGIPEAELPRLFDRFFRSEAVRNTSTHGSGLGLSISRDIIRSHGGEITVQSTVGTGTTFVLRLPIGTRRTSGPSEGTP